MPARTEAPEKTRENATAKSPPPVHYTTVVKLAATSAQKPLVDTQIGLDHVVDGEALLDATTASRSIELADAPHCLDGLLCRVHQEAADAVPQDLPRRSQVHGDDRRPAG